LCVDDDLVCILEAWCTFVFFFFFSSRRRHTRSDRDWSSDVCSSDLEGRVVVMFGDFVHPFLAHAIFATNTTIAQHPDHLRRFLKGWFETIAFSKTHKA